MILDVNETTDDRGRPLIQIYSDKRKGQFVVFKPNEPGSFFRISTTVGKLPKTLTGSYTTMKLAKDAVLSYIAKAPTTKAKSRDDYYEERHAKKE